MEAAQKSTLNVEKPDKLLGSKMNEQIESVILEAAHNACKSGRAEGKSLGEGKSLEAEGGSLSPLF